MTAIWVLENIKKDESFYNELDLLLLYSSVLLFKTHHRQIVTDYVLYCDSMTDEYIKKHNKQAYNQWTEIRPLPTNKFVDKSIFWASSKLEVLRTIKEKCVVIDHDFLAYKRLPLEGDSECIFAHIEKGYGYYPTRWDPYIREISDLINTPGTDAINCCFNYFDDHKIANGYAKLALEVMSRLSELKVSSSKYLIFSEQLVLKHFMDYHNIPYRTLLNAAWHPEEKKWSKIEGGYIDLDQANLHFRHYWMDKPHIRENTNGFDYNTEITILKNILNKLPSDKKRLPI